MELEVGAPTRHFIWYVQSTAVYLLYGFNSATMRSNATLKPDSPARSQAIGSSNLEVQLSMLYASVFPLFAFVLFLLPSIY